MAKIEKRKIKVLKPMLTHKVGDVIEIEVDQGVPVDRFWRDRWKDSQMGDNHRCIEFVAVGKKQERK